MFQYFGSKPALYEYLFHYCVTQMRQAYRLDILDDHTDFFDRVWAASVMKVENLKQHPYVAAFITSAAAENASDLQDALSSAITEGRQFTEVLVLHEEDRIKFKHPEDAALVFQMLLLGDGMVSRCENGINYDRIMSELEAILQMLKRNFYKEEYLQ